MFGAQPLEDIAAEFYHNLAQQMAIKDTSTHDTEFRLADIVGCQTPAFLAIRQLLRHDRILLGPGHFVDWQLFWKACAVLRHKQRLEQWKLYSGGAYQCFEPSERCASVRHSNLCNSYWSSQEQKRHSPGGTGTTQRLISRAAKYDRCGCQVET